MKATSQRVTVSNIQRYIASGRSYSGHTSFWASSVSEHIPHAIALYTRFKPRCQPSPPCALGLFCNFKGVSKYMTSSTSRMTIPLREGQAFVQVFVGAGKYSLFGSDAGDKTPCSPISLPDNPGPHSVFLTTLDPKPYSCHEVLPTNCTMCCLENRAQHLQANISLPPPQGGVGEAQNP